MSEQRGGGLLAIVAWIVFPMLPVVLENFYSGVLSLDVAGYSDPRVWNWFFWLIQLGPIVGYGFLAGATIALPDEPTGHRGPRAWLSRRWFWVAVGPWAGFLVWAALVWIDSTVRPHLPNDAFAWVSRISQAWQGTWTAEVFYWAGIAFVVTTLCYGWLIFAFAAIRRAKRIGTAWASVRRGLAVASAFVGSLFGSFWAITEWWRGFFFDARVFPVVLAAVALAAVCGCGPVTYGEVRRRELFHAMLLAWTVGLALIWRWWARPRPGPPG